MSIFSAIGGIVSTVLKPLLSLLTPKIPKQDTSTGDPVFVLRAANEYPNPGDPEPILIGEPTFYPLLLSRHSVFIDNRQVEIIYLYVCDGPCQILEITNDKTPFAASAVLQIQELQPGDTATLDRVYTYLNPDLQNLDLLAGALDLHPYHANVTFSSSGAITINTDDEAFDDTKPGGRFTVTGSASNDVEFIIDTITDALHATAHRTDGLPIVNETVDCTLNIYAVVIGGGGGWAHLAGSLVEGSDDSDPEDILVSFDHGDGTRGIIALPSAEYMGEFAVNDLIQAVRTEYNDGIDYRIDAMSDRYMIVSPAPIDEAENLCAIVRVRRQYGPYALCAAGQVIDSFNLNMVAASGLYRTNSKGKLRAATVGFEPLVQLIDDYGNALGPITSLGESEMSGSDRTPQRVTFPYAGLTPGRYQLFIARTTPASDDAGRSDAIAVESAVGFVIAGDVDPAYSDHATRLLLRVTSSAAVQGDINVRVRARGMKPLLIDGEWTEPQPTVDIAPGWAELRRRRGFPVSLTEYAAAHAYWQALGWTYHAYLRDEATLKEATETLLAAGDAKPWYDWRTNVDTMWRDRARADPVLMIHDDNRDRGTLKAVPIGLAPEDAPTGVLGSYADPRTGEKRTLPVAGGSDSPTATTYAGVQSRQQAWELEHRDAGRIAKRRRQIDVRLLWLQVYLDLGSPVLVQSYERRWGQFARLSGYSGSTLTADRELEWHETLPHRVWLPATNGAPGEPINCSRGANDRELVLESAPPGALSLGQDGGKPQAIILGRAGDEPQAAIVLGVGASDGPAAATVQLVLDDASIFDPPGPVPADEYPTEGEPPDLEIDDFALAADGQTLIGTWTPPAAQIAAQMEYQLVGGLSWTSVRPVVGGSASEPVLQGGSYRARVRAFGPAGSVGPVSNIDTVTVAPAALSVTIDPSSIPATIGGASELRSPLLTPVIAGGTGPFTGTWVKVSGNPGVSYEHVSGPTVITAPMPVPATKNGVFRYDVTDSLGATASSPTIAAVFQRPNNSGPIP